MFIPTFCFLLAAASQFLKHPPFYLHVCAVFNLVNVFIYSHLDHNNGPHIIVFLMALLFVDFLNIIVSYGHCFQFVLLNISHIVTFIFGFFHTHLSIYILLLYAFLLFVLLIYKALIRLKT